MAGIYHKILCDKLNNYGFRGKIKDLITSVRKQFITVNGFDSQLLPISCGVPERLTSGSLLFLQNINKLKLSEMPHPVILQMTPV